MTPEPHSEPRLRRCLPSAQEPRLNGPPTTDVVHVRGITSPLGAAAFVLIALAAGCAHDSDSSASGAGGRPPVAVAVAPAVVASMTQAIDVIGSLEPKFSADVKSEITGTVTAVYVTQWVAVRAGTPLARLDTSEMDAAIAALHAAEAQARVAETRAMRELERARQLEEFGLITPQALDDARSAVEAAEAATRAAAAQVRAGEARLAKSFLRSPMTGVVSFRGVNVGDRLENMGGEMPAFRIVDNRVLNLTLAVPSSRLHEVGIGQRLEFTSDASPGRTFVGTVMFINPAIDEGSRSAKVVAEVVNADGALKGGAFVKGRILVEERQDVLQVPRAALLNWDLDRSTAEVFVVQDDRADKRRVTVGHTNGVVVEIASGVAAGERVVTRGGFALSAGDRVTVTTSDGA